MNAINITKDKWPDIVVAFLLDKMIKGDDVLGDDERFNDLMKVMETRGLKPILLHYYMSSDPTSRSKYKMIGKSFKTGNTEGARISIAPSKTTPKKDTSTIKNLIKKALRLVVAHKKRSGFPLSEEKVDKILDKLLKEENIELDELNAKE